MNALVYKGEGFQIRKLEKEVHSRDILQHEVQLFYLPKVVFVKAHLIALPVKTTYNVVDPELRVIAIGFLVALHCNNY